MDTERFPRALLWGALAACAAAVIASPGFAQRDDVTAGAKLYVSQCKICHGSISALDQDQAAPALPRWQLARLAMHHGARGTRTDTAFPVVTSQGVDAPDRLAFAPPFGPHLRGVYGRAAGTVQDFQYSTTFM